MTAEQIRWSQELRPKFAPYVNSLHLRSEDGTEMRIEEDGSGTFRDRIEKRILESADAAMQLQGQIGFLPIPSVQMSRSPEERRLIGLLDFEWDTNQDFWIYLKELKSRNQEIYTEQIGAMIPEDGVGIGSEMAVIPENSRDMKREDSRRRIRSGGCFAKKAGRECRQEAGWMRMGEYIKPFEGPLEQFPEDEELPEGVKCIRLKDTYGPYGTDFRMERTAWIISAVMLAASAAQLVLLIFGITVPGGYWISTAMTVPTAPKQIKRGLSGFCTV